MTNTNTPMPLTAGEIKAIIRGEYEAEQVNHAASIAIAAHCEAHAGKPITEKNKPDGWHIVKHYGRTSLQTPRAFFSRMGTQDSYPAADVDLILDHRETYATYPTAEALRAENLRYFDALLERQASREALLSDPARLRAIANALRGVRVALQAVAEVLPNGPARLGGVDDRYRIIEAAGLSSVRVGRLQL